MLRLTLKSFVSSLRTVQRRSLHSSNALLKAEFFKMPAMSPTMNEGGVTEWKFKEGEAFQSGDILLEVETDKSTIDVEAQDDGILAKIILGDGSKDIKVGEPIAIIAEEGDDLSNLPEVPTSSGSEAPAKEEPKQEEVPKKEVKKSSPPPESRSSKADPKQTFFPSVASLLDSNHISREEALEKIQASGPNGRLLKGDVLAHLGQISQDSVSSIANFINSHSKLDLSNIERLKITPKEASEAKKGDVSAAAPAKAQKPKPEAKIISETFDLSSLQDEASLFSAERGINFDLTRYVNEASKRSQQFAYQKQAVSSDYYDSVFEDLVALPNNLERFTVKLDLQTSQSTSSSAIGGDIFDLLDFVDSKSSATSVSNPTVSVKVTVNPKVADAEAKANAFLTKFRSYITNPGF